MKAIFETGGKQDYVSEGDVLYVEKLDAEAGKELEFSNVLMVDGKAGSPYVKGAKVVCNVEKHGKQKKLSNPDICSYSSESCDPNAYCRRNTGR